MTKAEQIEAEIEEGIRDGYGDLYGGETSGASLEDFLENGVGEYSPPYRIELHQNLASFYRWGTNYDSNQNPFNLFRDLVGWSDEVVGAHLYDAGFASFGHVEAAYLSEALEAWSSYPYEVELWLNVVDSLETA